jgi:hypothetical protein
MACRGTALLFTFLATCLWVNSTAPEELKSNAVCTDLRTCAYGRGCEARRQQGTEQNRDPNCGPPDYVVSVTPRPPVSCLGVVVDGCVATVAWGQDGGKPRKPLVCGSRLLAEVPLGYVTSDLVHCRL